MLRETTLGPASTPDWLTPESEAAARRVWWNNACGRDVDPEQAEAFFRPSRVYLMLGVVLVAVPIALFRYMVCGSGILIGIGLVCLAYYVFKRLRWGIVRAQIGLATRGRVRMAWPIMMNQNLINGTRRSGGALVLVCGDDGDELPDDMFMRVLRVVSAAGASSNNAVERELAALNADETYVDGRRRKIPESLTDRRLMFACDLFVRGADLGAKVEDCPWVPCLVEPGEAGAIEVLSPAVMAAALDRLGAPTRPGASRTGAGQPPPLPGRAAPPTAPPGPRTTKIPSIMLFRTRSAGLDLARVREIVGRVLSGAAKVTEVGKGPIIHGFMIEDGGAIYAVHDSTKPYVARPGLSVWASGLNSVQATRLAEMHSAYVAVDCMKSPADAKVMYSVLGRLAAELLDDHCVLLYSTELGTVAVPDEGTQEALRTDPMGVFPGHGVSYVGPRNETTTSQIAEARRRWPEFETAFREHAGDGLFMVKAGFQHERGTEHMWFVVDTISEGRVSGKLANKPVYFRGAAEGDRVSEVVGEISDWAYAYAGNAAGGFTDPQIRAMLQR